MTDCPFCSRIANSDVILSNEFAVAFPDGYPVSAGHMLIVPRRHIEDFFSLAAGEVDHFLPWSRYPDNGIENLVVAHRRCNNDKRDFLAASEHVENWSRRLDPDSVTASDLATLSKASSWERKPEKTRSAARALYLRLPAEAKLWRNARIFVPADFPRLRAALCHAP